MIDFSKTNTFDLTIRNKIISNGHYAQIAYNERVDEETGEIYSKKALKDTNSGIILNVKNKRTEILLKPHHKFNNGLHNANDFSINNCVEVYNEYIESLNLSTVEIKALPIVNAEFKIDIVPDPRICDALEFIDMYLGFHEKKAFRNIDENRYFKIACSNGFSKHKQIKCYAKGFQYPDFSHPNRLRFEITSRKQDFLKQLDIRNLFSFTKFETYERICECLMREFESLLILEPIEVDYKNITSEMIQKLNYSNPNFWKKIINSNNRNSFSRHKKNYENLLANQLTIKNYLKSLIVEKINFYKKGAICPLQ
ncbi:MAG: hypothetical protein BGO86_05725 [Chryseobacterium sp. 36-9]|nr:MAG: hypothetical protein BGO86_05725 [Chryseobacterium sp. 36-9]